MYVLLTKPSKIFKRFKIKKTGETPFFLFLYFFIKKKVGFPPFFYFFCSYLECTYTIRGAIFSPTALSACFAVLSAGVAVL